MEIRWVLGLRTREFKSIQHYFKYFKDVPAQYIRIDPNIENFIPIKTHEENIALVKQHCGTPIKIGGDLSLSTIRQFMPIVSRFDVTVTQAKKIIKELTDENNRPREEKPKEKEVKEEITGNIKRVDINNPNVKVVFEDEEDGDY